MRPATAKRSKRKSPRPKEMVEVEHQNMDRQCEFKECEEVNSRIPALK